MASNGKSRYQSISLKPEEASFLDLFRILFSSDIKSKRFIETVTNEKIEGIEVTEKFFERRGVIFVSTLVQKVLKFIANPLSSFGSRFEQWLNLLSRNDNFVVLLTNLLQRKEVDKESATFLSTIGHLDKRVELDRNIKPGDSRYFVELSAMASKIAYENKAFIKATVEDRWKMELLGAYDFQNEHQRKRTTQALILHDKNAKPNMIVVAFRGTEPFDADAWSTDFDISLYKLELQSMGKVHGGFLKALGLPKDGSWPQKVKQNSEDRQLAYYAIREKLRKILEMNNGTKFIVTGHSLGGALAVLFPAILALHEEDFILERLESVYTFGQPRVGNGKFGRFMKEKFKKFGVKYYRFVYSHDIVPRVPFDNSVFMFKHFGTCIYYDSLYEGKIVKGELYENYFSLFSFIPKRVDAIWELVRSFIIPYTNGPDYTETLLLRLVRIFGLVFPGVIEHGPQDYVNATRLGAAHIWIDLKFE